ncbi:hypothetical protein VTH82DRAFT_2591 [Thermothelomyces myriococcoides]
MGDFTVVPTLDLSLASSPETKAQFLSELRDALVRVGFFYVKNHSIPGHVQQDAIQKSTEFFNLPLEKKLEVETVNSRHFLGYNRMDAEKTGARIDHNESIAIGADLPAPGPEDPVYLNLQGPSQWPDETAVPGSRKAIEEYRSAVQTLASDFTVLIEEALELEPTSLTRLFVDSPFSRLKITSYPPPPESQDEESEQQGVGAHKDGVFMTYLLQGGEHNCLEVQNKSGAWIPVPPVPGTLVVNIGRILEILTHGVCTATTHRVLINSKGFYGPDGRPLGPRLSLPFFQHVNLHLKPEDLSVKVPDHIADLVKGERVVSDAAAFFSGLHDDSVGDMVFVSMLTSFQAAAKRWYPELLPKALARQAEVEKSAQHA